MRTRILTALAAAAMAVASAPAFAQPVEQLTVTGQWNGRGEPPQTLSRVVDYRDLDLRQTNDQRVLRERIQATARDICDDLGQDHSNPANLGRSCQDNAVRGASDQVNVAVADAMTRGATAYGAAVQVEAPSIDAAARPASSFTTTTVTNGPVPDTAANRARFGGPMSHAGRRTRAAGN